MKSVKAKHSQGAALVLAMLIVAMVTAISVELTWRFDLGATRSGNRWYGMQANSYLEGAEEVAKFFLKLDFENSPDTDSLDEDWARQPMEFPTDHGYIRGQLQDATGRFNLNLMAPEPNLQQRQQQLQQRQSSGARERWQDFTSSQRKFIRLLQTIPIEEGVFLDQQTAENMTEAVIDWMDVDSVQTGFGGAESDFYGNLDIPYTIANKPMVSVSELRIIKGLNELPQSFFEALYPLVIALPRQVKINVNTAPLEVLRTFNREDTLVPLTPELGQNLLEDRGLDEGGFDGVGSFVESTMLPLLGLQVGGENNNQFDQNDFAVNSSYFILLSETQVGDRVRRNRSMLQRISAEDVKTLRRTNANF